MQMNESKDGCDILLVGYEDEENLGIRSIAAFLSIRGLKVKIEPYKTSLKEKILYRIQTDKPKIVGFSLIFQGMITDFAELTGYLRAMGVSSHFTIGGHFPTLDFEGTLELMPAIDTVIRHEGEETLFELYQNIDRPDLWPQIKGLVYRIDGRVITAPPRPLINDLDSLPFSIREESIKMHRGLGTCAMLASRGCYYDCSFCSIRQFYGSAPGPLRRSRSPSNVAKEMKSLFDRGARIFTFKDDDIGTKIQAQRKWLENFALELERSGISDEIIWRIACRVDEIDRDMLKRLKEVGLSFLYLGIEAGCNQGLETCNKHYRAEKIYHALDILRDIGISYEYGFMIFDPDSTFESIKKNINFLEYIGRDGSVAIHFTKMFPYVGTPIAYRLRKEGRLKGSKDAPNYSFKDRRMDLLEVFFSDAFSSSMYDKSGLGLVYQLQLAKADAIIIEKFFPDRYDARAYAERVKGLTKIFNESCVETMRLAVGFIESKSYEEVLYYWEMLKMLSAQERDVQQRVSSALNKSIPKEEELMSLT
jgi:anaerobic magnesium-protoporphyrin IX monomethyl ester cyclase